MLKNKSMEDYQLKMEYYIKGVYNYIIHGGIIQDSDTTAPPLLRHDSTMATPRNCHSHATYTAKAQYHHGNTMITRTEDTSIFHLSIACVSLVHIEREQFKM